MCGDCAQSINVARDYDSLHSSGDFHQNTILDLLNLQLFRMNKIPLGPDITLLLGLLSFVAIAASAHAHIRLHIYVEIKINPINF